MLDKVPIPFEDFKEKLDSNSKLLFSGVFGSGKTTFINDFFERNSVKDEYQSIHIYPVNYSTVSNQDIFELIKYDILFQLLGKVSADDFEKLDIPYELTLYQYLITTENLEDKLSFFASFLNFIGKYGRGIYGVYEKLAHLKKEYSKFHKQFQIDDFEKAKEYLETVSNKRGHIYEEDFFTELIRKLILKVKENNDAQVVLVIDDLDRLDPDHIFRVLNIFSAHIDFGGVDNDNKFNFDKVVLVCDYNNIASVFAHRYGSKANFSGYINKFYNHIFWYDSSRYIQDIICKYFDDIKTGTNKEFFDSTKVGFHISILFKKFLRAKEISFRELERFDKKFELNRVTNFLRKNEHRSDKSIISRYNLNVELVLIFFIKFFNDDNKFNQAIDKISKSKKNPYDSHDENNLDKICELLLIINHKKYYESNKDEDFERSFNLSYNGYTFDCKSVSQGYYRFVSCNSVNTKGKEELNYFSILKEAKDSYIDYFEF